MKPSDEPANKLTLVDTLFVEVAVTNGFMSDFVKRMLQRELPEGLRGRIADELFARHVASDEAAFSRELYMDMEQLRCMVRHGMYVGSHGCGHFWMDTLTPQEQAREIGSSLEFLEAVGAPTRDWVMCYPYGAYNGSLLETVQRHHGALGLTTEAKTACLSINSAFTLPRLDANDLPQPLTASLQV